MSRTYTPNEASFLEAVAKFTRAEAAERRVCAWLDSVYGQKRRRRGKDDLHIDTPRHLRDAEFIADTCKADFLVSAVAHDDLTHALALIEVKSAAFDDGTGLPRNDGFFISARSMEAMRAESMRLAEASGTPCNPADRPDDQRRWAPWLAQSKDELEWTCWIDSDGRPQMLHTPTDSLRVVTVAPTLTVAAVLQDESDPHVALIPFHWIENYARPCTMPRTGGPGFVMRWANVPATYWHDMRSPSLFRSQCPPPSWAVERGKQPDRRASSRASVAHLPCFDGEQGDMPPTPGQLIEINRLAALWHFDPPRVHTARDASALIGSIRNGRR